VITYVELRNALDEGIISYQEWYEMMFFLLKSRTEVIEKCDS
jgi:hypothetical protein